MTEVRRAHLLRKHIFGAARAPLFVSAPVTESENGAHDHDFIEIVLIVGGTGTHVSTHGSQALQRGDFFVLRPGAWHAYRDCIGLQVYNCCCAPELLRHELALLGEDPRITRLLWTAPLAPGRGGILHTTLAEPESQAAIAHWIPLLEFPDEPFAIRAGYLLILLGNLAKVIYPHANSIPASTHTTVRQGVQFFEERYDEDWNLARLANLTRLNPSYLTRLFKASTGRAPMDYLARHRAERAANLLLTSDQSIRDIGVRVGWSDPNYFARRFKSIFGVTPVDLRRHTK